MKSRLFIFGLMPLLVLIVAMLVPGIWMYSAINKGLGDTAPAQECTSNPDPGDFRAAPYYKGPLFETHLHVPSVLPPPKFITDKLGVEDYASLGEEVTIEKIICLMDRENITRSVAFFPLVDFPFVRWPFVEIARRTVQLHQDRIIPFILSVPFTDPATQPETLEKIFDQNNNVFQGYGEIPFYWDEYLGLSPDSPIFLTSYDILEERGLAAMIHPARGQERALRKVFARNLKVTFILHSEEIEDSLDSILEEYPNVYYTLDVSTLIPQSASKAEFMTLMKENFHLLLDDAVSTWKPRIEAHPEKFIWGTDRFTPWNFDEEVGRVYEEFSRAFIGRLDPRVQEQYAYKNADRLFEARSSN